MIFHHARRTILITYFGLLVPMGLCAHGQHTHNEETLIATIQQRYEHTRQQIANDVLLSVPNEFEHMQSIMTAFEWRELQVDNLVNKLNNTVTVFGQQGLKWLLCPITDTAEIERRQTIIKTLVEDDIFFTRLQNALQKVKKGEDALLLYWDQKNPYHDKVKSFFYRLFPKKFNNTLNNSTPALDFGFLYTIFISARMLVYELGMGGIYREFTDPTQPDIDILRGLKQGFEAPIDMHNFALNKLYTSKQSVRNVDQSYNLKKWFNISMNGTAKDRHDSLYELSGKRKIGSIVGWASAGFSALSYDIFWGMLLSYAWDEVKERSTVINTTQKILTNIAALMHGLKELEEVVASAPVLRNCRIHNHLQQVMNVRNWSAKFKQLMALLYSATFDASDSWIYSRGKVLCAHKLLLEVRQELVPALQAVAQYDAYFSIAQLFKEHQEQDTQFCFVEFIEHATPYVDIQACWEPLVPDDQKITNTIQLGIHGKPNGMVITGPNGGGKSTFLKSLGHVVIMAQSWGIVPAQSARMTLFHGVRTSLDPKEDLSHGISTFMAQKKRIKELYDYLQCSDPTFKVLAMLDEPYRGTTDYQSAQRIYAFGSQVACLQHAIVCIATHVRKPIDLADEYPTMFANYHVAIKEPEFGLFKRTFKLEQGPAMWWFDDQDCAGRFVDWLDTEMRRRASFDELRTSGE